jgi:hypothetical protein
MSERKVTWTPKYPRDEKFAIGWLTGEIGIVHIAEVWDVAPSNAPTRIASLLKRAYQIGKIKVQ